ncbi:hypothetical protein [Vibrio owensii]|uniref:hypothetical protein n=1 Tax=Vibrio owensii TaxID=696485 RepID=UPI003CC6D87F
MTTNPNEFITLSSNSEIKAYFSRLKKVLAQLGNVFDVDSIDVESTYDNTIIHEYLSMIGNTLHALELKHWFTGKNDRNTQELSIDSVDSGFPLRSEITFLTAEKGEAGKLSGKLPSTSELRSKIEKHLLQDKTLPVALQQDLAARLYFELLEEKELFLNKNPLQVISLGTSDISGNERYLLHWANYDNTKNIPNIYIMMMEYSGEVDFMQSNDRQQIASYLESNSFSKTMLLQLAQEVDKHKYAHPKVLKRIHVGPIYNSGLTQHNDNIQDVLGKIKDENDNWVFAWSTEILRSHGQESVSTGLLSTKQREIFRVDSYGVDTFEAGASDITQSMIIPYGAYQALAESEENPLHNVHKFVIGPKGKVIFL